MGYKVLIVDDEVQIRKLLKVAMHAYDFSVMEAASGDEAIFQATVSRPDLLIVDLGLPDMDGKEVVAKLREWSDTPVIILSARDQEQEKIAALDLGADDYVTKPFSTGEVLARVKACLRRNGKGMDSSLISCRNLAVDLGKHRVTLAGEEIKLTPTEYDLLKVLAQNMGKVMTHKQLLKAVWGNAYDNDTHYIRIYIRQLRCKIEKDPTQPQYILTEAGVGYRLVE